MKRLLLIIATAILSISIANAQEAAVRSVKIGCVLDSEGTAHIEEWWDITAVSGTEWYLVRDNLGDIEIECFSVTDENGNEFTNVGEWDVDLNIDEKAGKCGINTTDSGCELCWGIGSYGDHKYDIKYKMRNAAKSLNDYDMLHLQFVNDELSSAPQNVRLVLEVKNERIDTTCARIWGFGYEGTCEFKNGFVLMQSSEPFGYYSSLILLLRLDKGIIFPTNSVEEDFQDHLDYALSGADFGSKPMTKWERIVDTTINIVAGTMVFFYYGGWLPIIYILIFIEKQRKKKRWLGTYRKKSIPWYRDIPFEGNIVAANYALVELSPARIEKKARVASAMIIRMINIGALNVRKDQNGKIEITFGDIERIPNDDEVMKELWKMMHQASGKDKVLQEDEFSTWSKDKGNSKRIADWARNVKTKGKEFYTKKGYIITGNISSYGLSENRKLFGLRNYLKDFTIIDERRSEEAVLWKDYLVFASLFGIADRVAKELKDIKPYEELDVESVVSTVYVSNSLGRSIVNAKASYDASVSSSGGGYSGRSYSGGGGHSSYSGGRGYSGGGHGGGSR